MAIKAVLLSKKIALDHASVRSLTPPFEFTADADLSSKNGSRAAAAGSKAAEIVGDCKLDRARGEAKIR